VKVLCFDWLEEKGRTMTKKILFALMAMMMLTAARCKDGDPQDITFDSPKCGAVASFTVSYFKYGDGTMVILPVSKVKRGAVFVIGLDPNSGFRNANVTVTGTSDGAGWINGTGSYNGLPKGAYPKDGLLEVGCVPTDPEHEEYKFQIDVANTITTDTGTETVTNSLDPRARVVN
jgi:hypothetical protein